MVLLYQSFWLNWKSTACNKSPDFVQYYENVISTFAIEQILPISVATLPLLWKIVFFGWFWRWESEMGSRKCWKKSEPKLSSTTSFCKVRSLPLLGSNGWYVLNIHWIGTKTDSIQYSFKTEARIQNKYSFFFKNLEYSFKINIHF